MTLSALLNVIQRQPSFEHLLRQLEGGYSARLSIADAAKPYALAALHVALRRPLLLVTARPSQARALRDEIAAWHCQPDDVLLFPELDVLPYEPLEPGQEIVADRLAVLQRLRGLERATSELPPPLVVACLRATSDLLAPPDRFEQAAIRLRIGDSLRPATLLERLLALGYEPAPVVDSPGQFGRRGGIVDVYPLAGDPCRIEFFGDEVESLRAFDPLTQRSNRPLDELVVTPASERGPEGSATLLEYLPGNGVLALDEREQIAITAVELDRQVESLRTELLARGELAPDTPAAYLPWSQLAARLDGWDGARLELRHDPDAETVHCAPAPAFGGRLRPFASECRRRLAEGQRVVVVTQQAHRLGELFDELAPDDQEQLGPPPRPTIVQGHLAGGWQSPTLGLTIFTDSDIFGWHKLRRAVAPRRAAGRRSFLSELAPGDLVVHVEHGIARYRGMVTMADNGAAREYLLLEYAEGDRLYVPADQADRVTRYIGAGDAPPTLTRLGTSDWTRAKSRVRRAVREIAGELLELYAAREQAAGFAFPPDTPWQRELEASFPYVETPDQLRALAEIKQDMERPRPMDRLLVGDVGYGKTELAVRAAFKAVEAGKQVAMLVPTTVLAQQHWNTFRERMGAFPVRIEMLSRFRSEREQRAVVQGLADGSVDICIGTHRLLQRDVRFKDLGLVIIDEEQRFGVVAKERLKQLRREVDVLTMTATPIPRTMHMALVGVRDMSTIETPPEERLPTRTYVMEYDEGLVREAILRELDRGGQVYYVHNRVQSIAFEARRLQRLVPEARIAVAHGQMPEDQLERVMLEFADGAHDVLVCTTIIESGLDIPNVNTLIVKNAHRFGLAQLYQLRGRVGRGSARAYAYFLFARDTALTEVAEKRLRTIFEATELGAGFRIALKDLEIRGAGNLLGAEQHGHINAVGFDLYTRLLAEAVQHLRQLQGRVDGAPAPARPLGLAVSSTSVSLPVPAYLPAEYIEDEPTRLSYYQRLAAVTEGPELGDLVAEMIDRFGPLPEPAQNLIYIASLRLAAQRAGVEQIQEADGEVIVKFGRLPSLNLARLAEAVGAPLKAGSNQLRLPRGRGSFWMAQLRTLVDHLPVAAAPQPA